MGSFRREPTENTPLRQMPQPADPDGLTCVRRRTG